MAIDVSYAAATSGGGVFEEISGPLDINMSMVERELSLSNVSILRAMSRERSAGGVGGSGLDGLFPPNNVVFAGKEGGEEDGNSIASSSLSSSSRHQHHHLHQHISTRPKSQENSRTRGIASPSRAASRIEEEDDVLHQSMSNN